MRTYTVYPPAKINLHLRILGRRKDGYHELETVFQTVGLCDKLILAVGPGSGVHLTVFGADIPADNTNLCVRAVQLFAEKSGEAFRCEMVLHKNIPPGTGLGGGSSNAAAVLKVLHAHFGMRMTEEELHGVARQLGADVPFFLQGGVALGTGIGDQLIHLVPEWEYWVLLVMPTHGISTRWAYGELKFSLTAQQKSVIFNGQILRELKPEQFRSRFRNDFEPVVFRRYPRLKSAKEALYKAGAFFASMSGTGSALFGLFREEEVAREAKRSLQNFGRTELVRPVTQKEIQNHLLRTESQERS